MSRLRALFAASALCVSPVLAAAATPPELIGTLRDFVTATSGTDSDRFATLFAPDASITDTLSPYHWQGQGSAARYFEVLQRVVKAFEWDNMHLVGDGDPFVASGAGFAYAALPLTVEYKVHGTPHHDKGLFTLSLRRDGTAWKITSATWTYTKPPA